MPRRLLLPCSPSQHLPGDTARRAPPPAEAAPRSATRRPPQAPGAPSRGCPIPASNSAAARAASSPLATRLTGLALRGPRSAQYPGRTARTPHTVFPPREGSRPGRGAERRSRLRGPNFSRGFRPPAPTPREFSNFPY